MKRSLIGWIALALLVVGGSLFAWLWFAGGSGEPSTELTTPPVALDPTTTEQATSGDSEPAEPPPTQAFVIEPGGSSVASFELSEELRGDPMQVVGSTAEIAGQVAVDPGNLSSAQFSDIIINARTFETDSARRDRAIRGPVILNSATDEFELITFKVTSTEGLAGSLTEGESVSFTVTGDLTIRDTTALVTFDVEAMLSDPSTILGSATSMVLRSDFGIGIPSVPGIANVSDEVSLTLDFVAVSS